MPPTFSMSVYMYCVHADFICTVSECYSVNLRMYIYTCMLSVLCLELKFVHTCMHIHHKHTATEHREVKTKWRISGTNTDNGLHIYSTFVKQ